MPSLPLSLGRARPAAATSPRSQARLKLRTRAPVLGINPVFPSPDLVALCAQQGADLIFVDCEHGGPDMETVSAMLHAAHAYGAAVVLRPWTKEAGVLRRFVDIGVDGFIHPDVESAEELRALHKLVTDFDPPGVQDFLHIVLLESKQAIGQLDAFCEMGVADALLVGSGDLAVSMGLPRRSDDARVRALSFEVMERARQAGVSAGAPVVRYGTQATFAAGGNLVMLFAHDLLRTAIAAECAAVQASV